MKTYRIFALLAVLALFACGRDHSTKPTERPTTVPVDVTPDSTKTTQQLADAMNLIDRKDWPQGQAALRAIIEDKAFNSLPSEVQYRVLSTAGKAGVDHGQPQLGYGYLVHVLTMPQAGFDDRVVQLRAAVRFGYKGDAVNSLTLLARGWPDRIKTLNPDFVVEVLQESNQLPHGAPLPLLRALYAAHWKLKWDVEPSGMWRDLTLLLLEKGQLDEAIDVSTRVTNVYDLIAMRVDRRFDVVVATHPAQFDIDVAANRELRESQSASENAPRSLELKSSMIEALLHQQHYAAMLAAADSVILEARSTNYPAKLYEDYHEWSNWFLDERAIALERFGRWDEAVAQLTAASFLQENNGGNVSQLINLGDLYCQLGRPREALAAIGRMVAKPSPYGVMQMEEVRLDAAMQLGDSGQVARSLQYLRKHRADAPSAYQLALIVVNQFDGAARYLIARLRDRDQRQAALASVQAYARPLALPRTMELYAQRRAVIARKDVQAAIQRVGRVESYNLEEEGE